MLELGSGYPWTSFANQWHFTVMACLLLLGYVKLCLLNEDKLFLRLHDTFIGDLTLECTEHVVHSPRMLAMFMVSYLHGC